MSTTARFLSVLTAFALSCATLHAQSADAALDAFRAGAWTKVLDAVKAVPADAADRPKALYLEGETYLVVARPDLAEASFRAVLAARPEAEPAKLGLGRALCAKGELAEAETILTALATNAAKDANVKLALGELRAKQKKDDLAKKAFAEAWTLEPKSAEVARAYCAFLWSTDDDAGAKRVVDALAKAQPKHAMVPFLQALGFERANEPAKAIEAYEKALALDASFLDAHKNLAILCHTRNPLYTDEVRTKKALEHYAKYFELGGQDKELESSYAQFKAFMDEYLGEKPK